jgi:arsenate reductase
MISNYLSNGVIQAYSAGSLPVGEVYLLSITYLQENRIFYNKSISQSWDEFEDIEPVR